MGLREQSNTLSSNWFKKYRLPYLLLYFDIIMLVAVSFFIMKDFAIGKLDLYFSPISGVFIAIVFVIIIIYRFNLSLLMFSLQRFGLYLSIIFATLAIIIDINTVNIYNESKFYIGKTIMEFVEKFFFPIPNYLEKPIAYGFYFYVYFLPIVFYGFIYIFKFRKFHNSAKPFDVLTGFYGSCLSEKLKLNGFLIVSMIIFTSALIGILSNHINWNYLYTPIMIFSIYIFYKRLRLKISDKKYLKIVLFSLVILSSVLVMYFQKIPHFGLYALFANLIIGYIALRFVEINRFKSIFVGIISFFILPILVIGYNPFTVVEYGVIEKNIPDKGVRVFYTIIDSERNLGIRVRNSHIVKPNYKKIEYIGNKTLRFTDKDGKYFYINEERFVKTNPINISTLRSKLRGGK